MHEVLMIAPRAIVRSPDDSEVALGPGALIGRLARADLLLDDPRVSEAHALVSLRRGELVLLALRGGLWLAGKKVTRVALRSGQEIELVPGYGITVVHVELADVVLGLSVADAAAEPLLAALYSLDREGLHPRYEPQMPAHLWVSGTGWRLGIRDQEPRNLAVGDRFEVDGVVYRAEPVKLSGAGAQATVQEGASLGGITVRSRFETVQLHREDGVSVLLSGIPARILVELGQYDAPVGWELVATTLWPETDDRFGLRRKWDRSLGVLRGKLRQAGLRADLIRPDGCGNVELFLLPEDRWVDDG